MGYGQAASVSSNDEIDLAALVPSGHSSLLRLLYAYPGGDAYLVGFSGWPVLGKPRAFGPFVVERNRLIVV
jgi:hypothetical protein